jgi:hypothetical protein
LWVVKSKTKSEKQKPWDLFGDAFFKELNHQNLAIFKVKPLKCNQLTIGIGIDRVKLELV